MPRLLALLACCLPLLTVASCADADAVVLYCSLDQVHSEELIREFERETGIRVRAEFDTEANKTVGLVERLRQERARPRCDVFWNNEIAHTVRLAEEGLLASYDSPSAADIPAVFRDPQNRWTGFAARARVLIVNTDLVQPGEVTGYRDLLDPKWIGKSAVARPLTGTTLTHAAALYEVLGEDGARAFWNEVKDAGVSLAQSNGQTMRLVSEGELAWAFTDTDDFNVALDKGAPVDVVYPDQDGLGTMVIPNTVCVLKDAPHPELARKLVDWILSKDVEAKLAASRSAQIPVRGDVPHPDNVRTAADFKVMDVDFVAVGRAMEERQAELKEMFLD